MGTAKLSDMKSLLIDLCLWLVLGNFKGLIDLGSSDCFVDSEFLTKNKIRTCEINPLPLFLIDGMVNCCIDQVVILPMHFACGSLCMAKCYMTPLDSSQGP